MLRMRLLGTAGRLAALGAVIAAANVAQASGTSSATSTFYVSPSGSDSNPGTAAAPWRTVARVNRAPLAPGDTVLFDGGATFTDQTLMPSRSGTGSAPITFGSYGAGRATIDNPAGAVWLPAGEHDLTFDDLDLTSKAHIVFASAASGSGDTGIVLERSILHDSSAAGLHVQPQDSDWLVEGNTFRHLGDSGLIVEGSHVTIDQNTITDTGWNTQITYGKHGIYAKGPDMTIEDNDISHDVGGSGVSLRSAGARVFGNEIHDTPYGITMFPEDPVNAGTSSIYYNRLWGISGFVFYYDGTTSSGRPSGIDVIWASNTSELDHANEAVNVSQITSARVWIENSIFTGSYGSAYRGCRTCFEQFNDWSGGTSNLPDGHGDTRLAPELSPPPALVPSSTSPVVDAGTAGVTSLDYVSGCDGAVLHYCRSVPDLGAVEATVGSPPPPAGTPATGTPAGTPTGGRFFRLPFPGR